MFIESLGKPKEKDGMTCFIRAMSFKRKVFNFENEVRIWAVVNDERLRAKKIKNNLIKSNLLYIPLDWDKIDLEILVGPCNVDEKLARYDKLKDYDLAKRKEGKCIQQTWIDRIVENLKIDKKKVNRSHLYDVPLWKYSKRLKSKENKK